MASYELMNEINMTIRCPILYEIILTIRWSAVNEFIMMYLIVNEHTMKVKWSNMHELILFNLAVQELILKLIILR